VRNPSKASARLPDLAWFPSGAMTRYVGTAGEHAPFVERRNAPLHWETGWLLSDAVPETKTISRGGVIDDARGRGNVVEVSQLERVRQGRQCRLQRRHVTKERSRPLR